MEPAGAAEELEVPSEVITIHKKQKPTVEETPYPEFNWEELLVTVTPKFRQKIELISKHRKLPIDGPHSGDSDFSKASTQSFRSLESLLNGVEDMLKRERCTYAQSTCMYYDYMVEVIKWELSRRV